ncbi:MFS transporter [Ekhidna sp.]
MDSQKALSQSFNQTLLGLIIGWGGFSTIIPNILGATGEIIDLGSFRSLRISSIIFFLFPTLIFVSYWWVRGAAFYQKYLLLNSKERGAEVKAKNEKIDSEKIQLRNYYFPNYRILFIAWLCLLISPIVLFVHNEFFLYGCPSGLNRIAITIYYYTFLGSATLLIQCGVWWKISKKNKDPRLIKAHILVFSLHLMFGVCIAAFIEPWMIYQNNYLWHIAIGFLIYLSVALICYYKSSINKEVPIFRRLAVCILVLAFIIGNFPMVNYEYLWSIILSIISLVSVIIYLLLRWKETSDKKGLVSLLIGLVLVLAILGSSQYYVVRKVAAKANYNYYLSREKAHKKVTSKKLYPFYYLLNDNLLNGKKEAKYISINGIGPVIASNTVTKLGYEIASKIESKSHELSSYLNGRISNPAYATIEVKNNQGQNVSIRLDKLLSKGDSNDVQNVFYKRYTNNAITSVSQTEINNFYDKVHHYIEDKFVKPHLEFIPTSQLKLYQKFFHPINYYTETLKHYREELNSAKKAQTYLNEFRNIDSIQYINKELVHKLNKIRNKLNNELLKVTEWNSALYASVHDTMRQDTVNQDILLNYMLGKNKAGAKIAEPKIKFFTALKQQQYRERFERAQIIFRSYLEDSQRIGLFAFIYTFAVLIMLYWIHRIHSSSDENQEKQSEEELPGGYLNISLIVFVVLVVHIARPIKPENINPENPYWMMDIANWYKKNPVQELFKDDETPNSNVNITNQMDKLVEEMKASNKKLLQGINNSNSALKDANARLENIEGKQ